MGEVLNRSWQFSPPPLKQALKLYSISLVATVIWILKVNRTQNRKLLSLTIIIFFNYFFCNFFGKTKAWVELCKFFLGSAGLNYIFILKGIVWNFLWVERKKISSRTFQRKMRVIREISLGIQLKIPQFLLAGSVTGLSPPPLSPQPCPGTENAASKDYRDGKSRFPPEITCAV